MKQKVSLVGNKCKCLIQKLKSAVHEENCHQQRWELCSLCAVRWKTCKMHHSATWHYFHPFQVLSAIWNARLCMRHVIVLAELQWVMVMECPQPHWENCWHFFKPVGTLHALWWVKIISRQIYQIFTRLGSSCLNIWQVWWMSCHLVGRGEGWGGQENCRLFPLFGTFFVWDSPLCWSNQLIFRGACAYQYAGLIEWAVFTKMPVYTLSCQSGLD